MNAVLVRRLGLAALVLIAFSLRLAYYLQDPDPYDGAGLSGAQGEVARNIVQHGKWGVMNPRFPLTELQQECACLLSPSEIDYSEFDRISDDEYKPLAHHSQGTALVMAGVWALTGDLDYAYVQILQIVLASLAVLLVYWTTLTLFRRRDAAFVAAGAYAVYAPLAWLMRIPFYEPWALLASLAVAAAFVKAWDSEGDWKWLVLTGVLAGVGLSFRPAVALIPLMMSAALLPSRGWRQAARFGAVTAGITVLLALPWTIRNFHEFDRFIPFHTGTGQVLWEGFGDLQPNPMGAFKDDGITFNMVHSERPDLEYGTPEYDDFLFDKSTAAIGDHPGFYAHLLGYRALKATIRFREPNWNIGARTRHEQRGESTLGLALHPFDATILFASEIGERLVILVALLTLILTWGRFREQHLLLLAYFFSVIIIPLLLLFEWRYVMPAYLAWLAWFALGVTLLIERIRRRGLVAGLRPGGSSHAGDLG